MLLVAGTIEGFFSPRHLPPEIRIAFGSITALALVSYFAFAGRLPGRHRFELFHPSEN
jgi:hypothetical protein